MTEENLASALAKVQAELPTVKKGETADTGSYSYRYADLADITRVVYPLLGKHGLAFVCLPCYVDDRYALCGQLEHVSGQTRVGWFPLNDRATPQQIGSALTYGRRYLLGCLTGVVAEEDDDGKAAAEAPPPKRQRKTPAEKTEDNLASGAQLAKMHLLFNANGLKDREERLAFTAELIKHDLTTSAELTKDEASRLIDHLSHLANDDAENKRLAALEGAPT